jgi:hypothetical protein
MIMGKEPMVQPWRDRITAFMLIFFPSSFRGYDKRGSCGEAGVKRALGQLAKAAEGALK